MTHSGLIAVYVFWLFNFLNNKNLKSCSGYRCCLFLGFLAVNLAVFAALNLVCEPSTVLWFAAVPLLDFLAVVTRRTTVKGTMAAADSSHIHHFILYKVFTHFQS